MVDFHACRKAFITHVVRSGADPKEAQTLARHTTPELTMNLYTDAEDERLAAVVGRVADQLLPESGPKKKGGLKNRLK